MADRRAGKGAGVTAIAWLVGVLGFVVLPYKFLLLDWFGTGLGTALGGAATEEEVSAAAAGPVLALVSVVCTVFVLLALNLSGRSSDADVPQAPGSSPVVLLATSGLIAAVFLGAVLVGGSQDTPDDTGVAADPLEGGYGVGPDVAPGYANDQRAAAESDHEPVTIEPEDVDRVLHIVAELPDASSEGEARAALEAEFPDVDVDVVDARRGAAELVVAVGVGWARDCVVVVRPDGEAPAFRFTDFDRALLEPGELGCSPYLYLSPVTTH